MPRRGGGWGVTGQSAVRGGEHECRLLEYISLDSQLCDSCVIGTLWCAGVQAFAAALVAFAGLYLRFQYTINPRAVYRQAMVKLNTNASVLEVSALLSNITDTPPWWW